jgi:hypothetical protein
MYRRSVKFIRDTIRSWKVHKLTDSVLKKKKESNKILLV